jgi:hypothetical protein
MTPRRASLAAIVISQIEPSILLTTSQPQRDKGGRQFTFRLLSPFCPPSASSRADHQGGEMQIGMGSTRVSSWPVRRAIARRARGPHPSLPRLCAREIGFAKPIELPPSEYHGRGNYGPFPNPHQRVANEHLEVPIRGDRGSARGAHRGPLDWGIRPGTGTWFQAVRLGTSVSTCSSRQRARRLACRTTARGSAATRGPRSQPPLWGARRGCHSGARGRRRD